MGLLKMHEKDEIDGGWDWSKGDSRTYHTVGVLGQPLFKTPDQDTITSCLDHNKILDGLSTPPLAPL